jgi:hypothetical protein
MPFAIRRRRLLLVNLFPVEWLIQSDVVVAHCQNDQVTNELQLKFEGIKGFYWAANLVIWQAVVLEFVQIGDDAPEFKLKEKEW